MSVGSGLYLAPNETSPRRISAAIRQIIEGRSNAVGTATLTHDGVATTTTVTAPACGQSSAVFLFPTTAHAAAVVATTYVSAVAYGSFTITHATTSNADVTFYYAAFG